MPLGLQKENLKSRAASYRGLALLLIVHRYSNTYLCQFDLIVLHIFQADLVFRLLVPSKIFKITHSLSNPSIKITAFLISNSELSCVNGSSSSGSRAETSTNRSSSRYLYFKPDHPLITALQYSTKNSFFI